MYNSALKVFVLSFLLVWLFPSTLTAQTMVRSIPVPSPNGKTDVISVVIGQNFRAWTNREFERVIAKDSDGYPLCDFCYDGRTRKIGARSINLIEVDDAVDIRCVRVPGEYPNTVDLTKKLGKLTKICQIGASGMGPDGISAYETVIEFFTNDNGTGYLCFSFATGKTGFSRYNEEYRSDDTVCHIKLDHKGTMWIGYSTDPRQRPPFAQVILGNVHIQGCLRVGDQTIGTCSAYVTD